MGFQGQENAFLLDCQMLLKICISVFKIHFQKIYIYKKKMAQEVLVEKIFKLFFLFIKKKILIIYYIFNIYLLLYICCMFYLPKYS